MTSVLYWFQETTRVLQYNFMPIYGVITNNMSDYIN